MALVKWDKGIKRCSVQLVADRDPIVECATLCRGSPEVRCVIWHGHEWLFFLGRVEDLAPERVNELSMDDDTANKMAQDQFRKNVMNSSACKQQ